MRTVLVVRSIVVGVLVLLQRRAVVLAAGEERRLRLIMRARGAGHRRWRGGARLCFMACARLVSGCALSVLCKEVLQLLRAPHRVKDAGGWHVDTACAQCSLEFSE